MSRYLRSLDRRRVRQTKRNFRQFVQTAPGPVPQQSLVNPGWNWIKGGLILSGPVAAGLAYYATPNPQDRLSNALAAGVTVPTALTLAGVVYVDLSGWGW